MSNRLITDHFPQQRKTTTKSKSTRKVEEVRKTASPTVDQSRIGDLEILKQFDLTLEYGPCTGITRMQRWERADKHGLNPPTQVKDLVQLHLDDEEYTLGLWKDYDL